MDSRRARIKICLCGEGDGLWACVRFALMFAGLGVLLLPVLALGQAQTSEIQVRPGVPSQKLLDSNLQAHEEREQAVIRDHLVLSAEQRTPAFEAIRVSGGELFRSRFFPYENFLFFQDSIPIVSALSANADSFVGGWWRDFQQVPENAQNSFTAEMDGDPLPWDAAFGSLSPVAIQDSDAAPQVCLRLSPKWVTAGISVN